MSSPPTISIITPCHNASSHLPALLEHTLANDPPTELLLIDDGSTDDTLSVAAALARAHPHRVFALAQANAGPAAARNAGLRLARGRYVCFLDADDQLAPTFLSETAAFLDANPLAPAVSTAVEFLDLHRPLEPWQRQIIESTLPGNLLVRTDLARQIHGFPEDPAFRGRAAGEDGAFRRQLSRFGPVPRLDRPLYRHRVRPGSHFDFFLDRTTLDQGKLKFLEFSPEEADGSLPAAIARYEQHVRESILSRARQTLAPLISAGQDCARLARSIESLPGSTDPHEGFPLYCLAQHWPADGAALHTPTSDHRLLAWLSAACQSSKTPLLSIDTAPPPASLRLLVIAADTPTPLATRALAQWQHTISPHGLLAIQRPSPADTESLASRLSTTPSWRPLFRAARLTVLERVPTAP